MAKKQREEAVVARRTREELAGHFMRLRLQESERRAQEYLESLDPRDRAS